MSSSVNVCVRDLITPNRETIQLYVLFRIFQRIYSKQFETICNFKAIFLLLLLLFLLIYNVAELQIRRGNRDDLGTIFHIFLLKHIL